MSIHLVFWRNYSLHLFLKADHRIEAETIVTLELQNESVIHRFLKIISYPPLAETAYQEKVEHVVNINALQFALTGPIRPAADLAIRTNLLPLSEQ